MIACEYMEKQKKYTFLMPFIILVSFVTPSLAVTAYVRPTAGYDALMVAGWFVFVKIAAGIILTLATLCAILYLLRAEGKGNRAVVLGIILVLWFAFWYAMR